MGLIRQYLETWDVQIEFVLISLLIPLVVLLVRHRLAIAHDKLKEFKEAAKPIREWILEEVKNPSSYSSEPTTTEIDAFVKCLRFWKRRGFRKAYERQDCARQAAEVRNGYGEVLYNEDKHIKKALNELLRYTQRR